MGSGVILPQNWGPGGGFSIVKLELQRKLPDEPFRLIAAGKDFVEIAGYIAEVL